jgi:hypothetical protein
LRGQGQAGFFVFLPKVRRASNSYCYRNVSQIAESRVPLQSRQILRLGKMSMERRSSKSHL